MAAAVLDTFCIECERDVAAQITSEPMDIVVRGEQVHVIGRVARCSHCGADIGDQRIVDGNLQAAYDVYRAEHGVMTPQEIRGLRERYGLTTREFSRFLGFGEQTEHRYEMGSLPTAAQAATIRRATTAEGARALLEAHGDRISEGARDSVWAFINQAEEARRDGRVELLLCEPEDLLPQETNGFRGFDLSRVRDVVALLAESCQSLYKTKLQKALFFCDNLACAQTGRSLTGLTYAHAPYGPVADRRDAILAALQDEGAVTAWETDCGDVFCAHDVVPGVLTAEEINLVERTISFVNTFASSKEISEFSHGLSSWQHTSDGERISFLDSCQEAAEAMEARLTECGAESAIR